MSSINGDEEVEFVDDPRESKLNFTGRGPEIFGIWILNLMLSILTLGIYSFWGRVNIRRYLWQSTRYEDEALEYTGTGGELFIGFLIVFFIVLIPISASNFLSQFLFGSGYRVAAIATGVVTYAGIVFLIGVAIHRVRKYRLSRTLWRGIRGALGGSSIRYGAIFLGYMALNVVTLGLAFPYTTVQLWSRLANDTWVGSGQLRFEGSARPLYPIFMAMWAIVAVYAGAFSLTTYIAELEWTFYIVDTPVMEDGDVTDENIEATESPATESGEDASEPAEPFGQKVIRWLVLMVPIVALGLFGLYQWFRASTYRLFAEGTTFENTVSFKLDLSGAKMLGFTLFNYFLLAITLGFATSYILIRGGRLIAGRLSIVGEPDYEAISQSTAEMPKFGEGLGEAFDIGGF